MGGDGAVVELAPEQTGVCVLRAWARHEGLVIVMRMRTDVDSPCTERVEFAPDVPTALRVMRTFLEQLAPPASDEP